MEEPIMPRAWYLAKVRILDSGDNWECVQLLDANPTGILIKSDWIEFRPWDAVRAIAYFATDN